MSRMESYIADLPPRARAIMLALGKRLSGFGRTSAGASLVAIRAPIGQAIPELRLALFLREEADAGEIKASRIIGEGGIQASAAELSMKFNVQARESTKVSGPDIHAGLAVLVATHDPSNLIRAANDAGLTATLVGRLGGLRLLARDKTRRRTSRVGNAAWPLRDGPSLPPS